MLIAVLPLRLFLVFSKRWSLAYRNDEKGLGWKIYTYYVKNKKVTWLNCNFIVVLSPFNFRIALPLFTKAKAARIIHKLVARQNLLTLHVH